MTKNSEDIKKILIVDDEELILELYSDFFEQKDFATLTAMNLREALEILESQHQDIDLVLADIMLPDGKGFKIHTEIKDKSLNIPIIFMTGFRYKPEIDKKLKEINANWLSKPIKMEQLFEMINDIFKS